MARSYVNPLTPNDDYSGRTAPLTSKRCILYIYSANTGTEYFKHGIHSPFFPLHKSNVFGSCIIHILYTGCAKIKKNNSGALRTLIEIICGENYTTKHSSNQRPYRVKPHCSIAVTEEYIFR